MALMVLLLTWPLGFAGQEFGNFAGEWTSSEDDLTVIATRDMTSQGWTTFLHSLERSRSTELVIVQNSTEITLTFPGQDTFLASGPYDLTGASRTLVDDHGDWWTKRITEAAWRGKTLTLVAIRQSGWWRTSSPSTTSEQKAQMKTVQVLSLNADERLLTVQTTVSDEKGVAEYRQVFHRRAF